MNREGITLYLQVEADELTRRLSVPKHQAKRPLIKDLSREALHEKISSMLSLREPYYLQAQLIVPCDNAPKEESLQKILHSLQKK